MFARSSSGDDPCMYPVPALERSTEALEQAKTLDPTAQAAKKLIDSALPSPELRDALHGVWFGHPLHPALILLPLGSWVSASVLDFLPGNRRAAQTLVGFGVLASVPTAAAGAADYADLHPQQQRVGVVHALLNTAGLGLQLQSWRDRRNGRQARGVLLSLAALGLGSVSAYLGGHMSYRQAAGVNHAEEAQHVLPEDWTRLCGLDELPDGQPTRQSVDGVPVFALRRDRRVDVLFDLCSHLSGPLSEGDLSGAGDELCVTCPWHGSVFRVRDGAVRRGPTTSPQPVLQVRVDPDGSVMVRLGEDD
jgi:nitrite reductase/ring-hydroxylating ferredoxin subunit/uncharacterized membrane protein